MAAPASAVAEDCASPKKTTTVSKKKKNVKGATFWRLSVVRNP